MSFVLNFCHKFQIFVKIIQIISESSIIFFTEKEVTIMKKLLLVVLAAFGTFALTGCEFIDGLLKGEKQYNYDDFRALLADKNFSYDYTKCHAVQDVDGTKSIIDYVLVEGVWKKEEGSGTTTLDIIPDVKSCELAAAFLEKKVDSVFKFYASNKDFRITAEYKNSNEQTEIEYKYNKDGLATYRYSKNTNLSSVTSTVKTVEYSYSE